MASAPSVSVIMSVLDGEAFISEALDSIASQLVQDMEVIVVDNGCRDNSIAIASSHVLRPRILAQPEAPLSAALNHAVEFAQGSALAFLDCDDVWPQGRLSEMLTELDRNPDIDVVYGNVVNTNENLVPTTTPLAVQLAGAMVVRRSAALRVGDFRTDITHAFVIDWISRARMLGLRFKEIDKIVLLRRIHGANMGIREKPQASENLLRVLRDHVKRKR